MLENKKSARMSAHGENAKTEQTVMSKGEHVVQTKRQSQKLIILKTEHTDKGDVA